MKAYGYLRVSSQGQVKGNGFDRQKAEIERYAEKAGIEIERYYQEDISGTSDETDRPAFQTMVAAILSNGVRTVIVEGMDRLAREYRIQESLLIYLASKGITLISARTEENVTDAVLADPMKKALVQIQGVFAEFEKNLLVKKLRIARERKKEETGKCEGRKSLAESNPELIREIKRLRRKSGRKKLLTYDQIAEELNNQGFKNQSGNPLTGPNVAAILRAY
jgi:DNA invertase Pin-like site-specific DNA recombinase